jgi:hypothetical protein
MNKLFFLSALFLLIGSCGKSKESTSLRFTKSFAAAGDTLQAGMIVYAVNNNGLGVRGSEFFDGESNNEADGGLKSLPNGEWLFYAVASSSTASNSAGGPLRNTSNSFYCGIANNGNPVELTGGGQTIDITFSVANCASHDIFAPSDFRVSGTNVPYDVSIHACTAAEFAAIDLTQDGVSSPASLCAGGSNFDGKIFVTAYLEYPLLSYLTVDPNNISYDVTNILSTSIIGCKDLSSGNWYTDLDEVALGNIDGNNFFTSPFLMVVSLMTGSCSDITTAVEVNSTVVPRGLMDADEGGTASSVISDLVGFADDSTPVYNMFFDSGL